jgi:hypothetical protein
MLNVNLAVFVKGTLERRPAFALCWLRKRPSGRKKVIIPGPPGAWLLEAATCSDGKIRREPVVIAVVYSKFTRFLVRFAF